MALRGTLEDINVVDLLQYPQAGRRTGEMVITAPDGEARVYYQAGAIVHAEMGREEGFEVLVGVLDWEHGEFEFHTNVTSARKSVRGQVIHLIMEAVREKDERKKRNSEQQKADSELARMMAEYGANGSTDPRLFKHLVEFIKSFSFPLHACIIRQDGAVLAEASENGRKPERLDDLRQMLLGVIQGYPRPALNRMCLEDTDGSVVVTRLNDSMTLLAVAMEKVPIGAISMGAAKLATSLEKVA